MITREEPSIPSFISTDGELRGRDSPKAGVEEANSEGVESSRNGVHDAHLTQALSDVDKHL